jgi:beta-galactosidase GanA
MFERQSAHHQELQTVFAASGLYTHVVTDRCPGWLGTSHPAWKMAGLQNISLTDYKCSTR